MPDLRHHTIVTVFDPEVKDLVCMSVRTVDSGWFDCRKGRPAWGAQGELHQGRAGYQAKVAHLLERDRGREVHKAAPILVAQQACRRDRTQTNPRRPDSDDWTAHPLTFTN